MWISASCEYEGAAGKEVFEVVCSQRRIARWSLLQLLYESLDGDNLKNDTYLRFLVEFFRPLFEDLNVLFVQFVQFI